MMGIFDFFRKKTDVEEYYEKREKEKENEKSKNKEFTGFVEITETNEAYLPKTDELNEVLNGNYNKIEKIKRVREIAGLSLKDAKELVEKNEKNNGFFSEKAAFNSNNTGEKNTDMLLKDLLVSNTPKLEKIKRVREITGLGLKDAKELVEKHER